MFLDVHDNLVDGLGTESVFTLRYSEARYLHVLSQLSDEDLWWRPYEQANAVGNIVLHAAGNLRQWVISGVGGTPDTRDRDAEFACRNGRNAQDLAEILTQTVNEAVVVLESPRTEQEWLRPRHIQAWDVTGLGAVMHATAHLEGHAQEVIYIARLRLGPSYRFKDVYERK